jgi:hypothetical protein
LFLIPGIPIWNGVDDTAGIILTSIGGLGAMLVLIFILPMIICGVLAGVSRQSILNDLNGKPDKTGLLWHIRPWMEESDETISAGFRVTF